MNLQKKPNMYKLLSVDDEPINQVIVDELLGEQFSITLAESGEECLAVIEQLMPDLILLDVSMSGMDGYSTCKALKKNPQSKNIPVFFVSARGSLEDKLQACDAGGYDFITKPFNHTELAIQINHTIESVRQAATESAALQQPAADYSDTNILLEFITNSSQTGSFKSLGEILLTAGQQLGLDCLLQFQIAAASYNIAAGKAASPLEKALLEDEPEEQESILEFNSMRLFKQPHLSMLIKNMPVSDETRCGQIKNILEALITGTESRIKALLCESGR